MPKRNTNIDLLKLILAFLVVAIHVFSVNGIPGIQGIRYQEIGNSISRIAVPLFFIIAGFFLSNSLNDTIKVKKYIQRLLLLFLVRQGIYFAFPINEYIQNTLPLGDLIRDLFYGYAHLRYISATIGAGILLYLTRNISAKIKIFIAIGLLVIGYMYQLAYLFNWFDNALRKTIYINIGTTRNFLFFAFPYMILGTTYTTRGPYLRNKIRTILPLGILLLGEAYMYKNIPSGFMDHYLTVIPLSILIFTWISEKKSQFPYPINRNLSLGIYLSHFFPLFLCSGIQSLPIKYVVVCCGSIFLTWILDKINRKFPYIM